MKTKQFILFLFYFTYNNSNSQVKEVNYVIVDSIINSSISMPLLLKKSLDTNSIAEFIGNSSNNNNNEILFKYLANNSFILILKYSNYFRYIYKFPDSYEIHAIDTFTKISKGTIIISDSTLEYTLYNTTIILDKNTKRLLEFNRFKTLSDSIDYNSFVIDRTVDNGSGYSFIFPIQWHLNGKLKSNVKYENNYIYVSKYNSKGNLDSLFIYLQYYDEIGLDVKLVKSIFF